MSMTKSIYILPLFSTLIACTEIKQRKYASSSACYVEKIRNIASDDKFKTNHFYKVKPKENEKLDIYLYKGSTWYFMKSESDQQFDSRELSQVRCPDHGNKIFKEK